jgi:hypothetical protein
MKAIAVCICLLMLSGCFIPTATWGLMTHPVMAPGIMIQPTKWPPIESGLYRMTDPPTRVVWPDRSEQEDRFAEAREARTDERD